MTTSIKSQNIYDLLGNTVEDETPVAPVKIVEKASTHTVKRNSDGLPPSKGPIPTGNRRGGAPLSGNEAAFRDRNAGRESNRSRPTEEGIGRGSRRGGFRGRGGRPIRDDRHTKSAPHSNSEKQAAQTWGGTDANLELAHEQAGEKIAESEQKEAAEGAEGAAEGEAPQSPQEPEQKFISYDEYLAQQTEKKLALEAEAALKVRKPNEGAEDKWEDLKPLQKDDEDELFRSNVKQKRGRERTQKKMLLELDNHYHPEAARGGRGGRGGARGEGGRGRGRGGGRGDFRGGRGRGAQENQPINTNDESAFPSLGSN